MRACIWGAEGGARSQDAPHRAMDLKFLWTPRTFPGAHVLRSFLCVLPTRGWRLCSAEQQAVEWQNWTQLVAWYPVEQIIDFQVFEFLFAATYLTGFIQGESKKSPCIFSHTGMPQPSSEGPAEVRSPVKEKQLNCLDPWKNQVLKYFHVTRILSSSKNSVSRWWVHTASLWAVMYFYHCP